MRNKLITLAVGILVASALTLPAAAGPGKGQGKGPQKKAAIPSACHQAAVERAKVFHTERRDAHKKLHADAKKERQAFLNTVPAPTDEQKQALREKLREAHKTWHKAQHKLNKDFHALQKATVKACIAATPA